MTHNPRVAYELAQLKKLRLEYRREGLEGQSFKVEQSTPSPFQVTFADLGLPNMADSNYRVMVGGETDAKVIETSLSPEGFSLYGGTITDVHHIVVLGQLV